MNEKIARIASATISFYPMDNSDQEMILGYQQNITLNRTTEKKELLSNDDTLGESVMEIETKAEYNFSTEIGDLNIDTLALCFLGLVKDVTYALGDKFFNGKTIKDSTDALEIGDVAMKDDRIYIATNKMDAGDFDVEKCATRNYLASQKSIQPQVKANAIGKILVDGTNLATGKSQVLIIPKVNLSFDGDIMVSGDDFAKLSLKGKVLKVAGEDLFNFIDA